MSNNTSSEVDEIGREAATFVHKLQRAASALAERARRRGADGLTNRDRRELLRQWREQQRRARVENQRARAWFSRQVDTYQQQSAWVAARHELGDLPSTERQYAAAYLAGLRDSIEQTVHRVRLTPEERGQVIAAMNNVDRDPHRPTWHRFDAEHGIFQPLTPAEAVRARSTAAVSEQQWTRRGWTAERDLRRLGRVRDHGRRPTTTNTTMSTRRDPLLVRISRRVSMLDPDIGHEDPGFGDPTVQDPVYRDARLDTLIWQARDQGIPERDIDHAVYGPPVSEEMSERRIREYTIGHGRRIGIWGHDPATHDLDSWPGAQREVLTDRIAGHDYLHGTRDRSPERARLVHAVADFDRDHGISTSYLATQLGDHTHERAHEQDRAPMAGSVRYLATVRGVFHRGSGKPTTLEAAFDTRVQSVDWLKQHVTAFDNGERVGISVSREGTSRPEFVFNGTAGAVSKRLDTLATGWATEVSAPAPTTRGRNVDPVARVLELEHELADIERERDQLASEVGWWQDRYGHDTDTDHHDINRHHTDRHHIVGHTTAAVANGHAAEHEWEH